MRKTGVLLALSLCVPAWGQIDASSAVLLRKGAKPPTKEYLDRSGRYTIRQEAPEPKRPAASPELPKKVASPTANEKPLETKPSQEAQVAEGNQVVTDPAAISPGQAEPKPAEPAPIIEQVKETMLGGSEEDIEVYRGKLHVDDVRNNLLEVEIAPAYLYTESSGNYWFRSYNLGSPGFMVAGQIWFTPFFGLRSSFINSLDASIYSESGNSNRLTVDQKWFDAGLRWRKFFGISRRAATLVVGIDFSEYQFHVPSSATQRVSLKTIGAKLSLEATLPQSTRFSWTSGLFAVPRADHKEMATDLVLRSGTRDETTVLGVWLGGNHVFSRQDQFFWKAQHVLERNRFEKSASTADPVTGETPTGVSVTSGTSMLIFGFRWGH